MITNGMQLSLGLSPEQVSMLNTLFLKDVKNDFKRPVFDENDLRLGEVFKVCEQPPIFVAWHEIFGFHIVDQESRTIFTEPNFHQFMFMIEARIYAIKCVFLTKQNHNRGD